MAIQSDRRQIDRATERANERALHIEHFNSSHLDDRTTSETPRMGSHQMLSN